MAFQSCTRCVASSSKTLQVAGRSISSSASWNAVAAKKGAKVVPKMKKQGGSFNKAKGGAASGTKRSKDAGVLTIKADFVKSEPDTSKMIKFAPELLTAEHIGQHVKYDGKDFETLKSFGLPRQLAVELSRGTPTTVIREVTTELMTRLEGNVGSSKDTRLTLTGPKGCGKSVIMLQAISACSMNGWITIYVPSAIAWTSSSSPYAYHPASQTFHQPTLSSSLLASILSANKTPLSQLKARKSYELENGRVEVGEGLDKLAERGATDAAVAVEVLEVLMAELGEQTEFNVLLAIDDVQSLFRTSKYRNPHFKLLETYALSGPRLFLDFIAGRKTFSSGALLTSLSYSIPDNLPPPELYTALSIPSPRPITPYQTYNPIYLSHAQGLTAFPVKEKLEVIEAAGMMRAWRDKSLVVPTDEMFLGKYAESAGNAGEFRRGVFASFGV